MRMAMTIVIKSEKLSIINDQFSINFQFINNAIFK
jgi:hypothetical protein